MEKQTIRMAAVDHKELIKPPFNEWIGLDGFDALFELCENFSGMSFYVPSVKNIFSHCLEKAAQNEFDGYNFKYLANRFGFTERHIRHIINKKM
ncbi:MAG: hypothetical protein FWE82_04110 [Defluviitaleaceae bacterium]|nr:hypothetical protein [Defluviitaleaceae bacterium]